MRWKLLSTHLGTLVGAPKKKEGMALVALIPNLGAKPLPREREKKSFLESLSFLVATERQLEVSQLLGANWVLETSYTVGPPR